VDPRLRAAVDANVGWYETLAAAHGLRTQLRDGFWIALGRPPRLHSDVMSVEPDARSEAFERAVADRDGWGFKDSFGTLEPTAPGVRLLFAATWIHATPPDRLTTPSGRWVRIRTDAELETWNVHADTDGVVLPTLLARGGFAVLERRTEEGVTAGAIARLGTGVVELSNVHGVHGATVDWAELTDAVAALFPGRPQVGYESGDDLAAAVSAGFEPVGQLRVWVADAT
jgi:hypothetical protein